MKLTTLILLTLSLMLLPLLAYAAETMPAVAAAIPGVDPAWFAHGLWIGVGLVGIPIIRWIISTGVCLLFDVTIPVVINAGLLVLLAALDGFLHAKLGGATWIGGAKTGLIVLLANVPALKAMAAAVLAWWKARKNPAAAPVQ